MKKFLLIIVILVINFKIVNAIELKNYYQFPDNYFKGKFSESSANFFLVGTNQLKDNRFKDAVILIKEHNSNGGVGMVINKPIGIVAISSLLEKFADNDLKKKNISSMTVPIFWGGPLDQKNFYVIHSNDYKNEDTKIYNEVSISNSPRILIDIAQEKGPKNSLIIFGLTAWNVGQLDGEIGNGWWNLSEVNQNILFEKINKNKYIMALEKSFIRL